MDPNATYTPLHLAPGQSGTITLTFTPNAPKGTVVRGFIGLDSFNLVTDAGDELINIPYPYKVGGPPPKVMSLAGPLLSAGQPGHPRAARARGWPPNRHAMSCAPSSRAAARAAAPMSS